MTKHRKRRPATRPASTTPASQPWLKRGRGAIVIGVVALIIATPLVTSDAAAYKGSHVVLVMAWMVLLVAWLVERVCSGQRVPPLGPVGGWLGLMVLWHSISAVVMAGSGHARPTFNAMWIWIAYGATFVLVRAVTVSPVAARAVCSGMIALGVGLSALGGYQYACSMPHQRAEYAKHPEEVLREAGFPNAPPGSLIRRHFRDRLASTEPFATFALANSLAGFLAPWLVLVLLLAATRETRLLATGLGRVAVAWVGLLMVGCLLLTKSRAALLAVILSLTLSGVVRGLRSSQSRRWILGLGCLGILSVVLAAAALKVGVWDRQMLTEAPKSVLYRLQYWQATSAMIVDHPWLGCGPGNFKEYYTQYKLPEASESISDPHNFLFEIAATAGLPALVAFLVACMVLIGRWWRCRDRIPDKPHEHQQPETNASPLLVYSGLAAGLVLAFFAGWAAELPPDSALLWVSVPVAGVTLVLLDPWVRRGTLGLWPIVGALAALLITLLAAGGIGFPGVGQLFWILVALSLNSPQRAEAFDPVTTRGQWPVLHGAWPARVALLVAVILVGACYLTMYRPVLEAKRTMARAREAQRIDRKVTLFEQAGLADPFWADPYENLADSCAQQWLEDPSPEWRNAFAQAFDRALERDRHSSRLYRQRGDWLLHMYAIAGDVRLAERSVQAFTRAVRLYPNSNILHAQLACALWLCGRQQLAVREANEALRLDRLVPHQELKLAARTLPAMGGDTRPDSVANTEQLMHFLRKSIDVERKRRE